MMNFPAARRAAGSTSRKQGRASSSEGSKATMVGASTADRDASVSGIKLGSPMVRGGGMCHFGWMRCPADQTQVLHLACRSIDRMAQSQHSA